MKARKPQTYKLRDAIAFATKHGFVYLEVNEYSLADNRIVSMRQDWNPRGEECIRFILQRGKYKGNRTGVAYRQQPYQDKPSKQEPTK